MSQSGLDQFRQNVQSLAARPGGFDIVQRVKEAVTGLASDIGVPVRQFTARAGELDDSTGVLRYQFSTIYDYETGDNHPDEDTPIGQIQFRTTVYTLTDPSDEFKKYIRRINHRRLHTLFNTGPYDGYIQGFEPEADTQNEESAIPVGQDEIPPTGLGVPNFSLEIYDEDGELRGAASGYSLDFGANKRQVQTGDAPAETWRVRSFNRSRGDYQISPTATAARGRAKNIRGKTVYLNGFPIGSVTTDGRVWLTKEHQRPGAATYRSRKYITENSGTPFQALSPGAKLYKVNETTASLYFSTVKPSGFQSADPTTIDPSATNITDVQELLDLKDDEPTEFVVTMDESYQYALGRYTPVVTRSIEEETFFTINQR